MRWPGSVLLVGCGNMGGAMLAGWLAAGRDPAGFTIVDPVLDQVPDGVELLRSLPDREFDAILLGVKPQMLADIAPDVAALAGSGTVVLSILAGVELASLARHFPQAGGIVRIMPNLSAAIGKSPVALAARGLDDAKAAAVMELMQALGTPEWLEDEGLFDLVTALAGSGPAFCRSQIRRGSKLKAASMVSTTTAAKATPPGPGAIDSKLPSRTRATTMATTNTSIIDQRPTHSVIR